MSSALPIRCNVEVLAEGRIEVKVPLPEGSRVTVYVTEPAVPDMQELLAASETSTAFWENSYDDEDWNDA